MASHPLPRIFLGCLLTVATCPLIAIRTAAQMSAAPAAPAIAAGLIAPEQLEKLLPPSVYFQGQTAPLQLRNAAGFKTSTGAILWTGLVDTSGYSTGIRERYQFYFVSETAFQVHGHTIAAGAYGGGFLSDGTFVLLDLGGRTIEQGPVVTDSAFRRPRPLQIVTDGTGLRLYLGRQYLRIDPLVTGSAT